MLPFEAPLFGLDGDDELDEPESLEPDGRFDVLFPDETDDSALSDFPDFSDFSGLSDLVALSDLSGLSEVPDFSVLSVFSELSLLAAFSPDALSAFSAAT